jgi:ubiquinone/menaquinone biosynthesis C-methylase UbiE
MQKYLNKKGDNMKKKSETRLSNPGWLPGNTFNILLKIGNDISKMISPKKGARVLDIACGPSGTCALSLMKSHINKEFQIIAIDNSKKVTDTFSNHLQNLKEGNKKYQNSRCQLSIKCMDVTKMKFPQKHFDYVTGVGALSNFDNPERALKEISRVLKDDGELFVGDFFLPKSVKDIWATLSAVKYGSPRPYLDYGDFIRLLHNSEFEISYFTPIRWLYNSELLWRNSDEAKKEIAKTLYDALPAWARKEIEFQKRGDGKEAMVYNSFFLKAKKAKKKLIARKVGDQSTNINSGDVWEVWD